MAIFLQCGRPGFYIWFRNIPWRREKLCTPVFYPGEFRGLFSPWSCKSRTPLSEFHFHGIWVQFSSETQWCLTLRPQNRSMPDFPVHHQLLEFTQTHVHRVNDAIQPSHPLSSPSPLAPNPSQHHSLFQLVNSSHEVAKVLEFQL